MLSFPIIVLLKDDHIDFVQEERLGLPYWTMILAICVVVDESKCLDTPILEFSIICEHLPFLLGCKPILRLLLVLCILVALIQYPSLLQRSFVMLMILAQQILQKIQNHLSQCHLAVQLGFCISGVLPPIQHFSADMCPLMMQNELCSARRPCFIDHFFLTSDVRQVPRRNFLQFFPFLVHRCFRCRNFHSLRHRNKFVNQIVVLILFLQYGLDDNAVYDTCSNSEFLRLKRSTMTRKEISALAPSFFNHFFFSDLCRLPCRYFLQFSHSSPLLPLHMVFS